MKSSRLVSFFLLVSMLAQPDLSVQSHTSPLATHPHVNAASLPFPSQTSASIPENTNCSGIFASQHKIFVPLITKAQATALQVSAVPVVETPSHRTAGQSSGDFAADNAFLYQGSAAVQHGLQPGIISPERAAVLRGRTCARNGTPLAGVNISILDHPEYGSTLSQTDGMFDLAVNGGEALTVVYAHLAYLPAQRKLTADLRDYTWLPDVVLIPLDSQVTTANLSGSVPMQTARGSAVVDADGLRQATLLIPQGTTAQLVMPGGATVPVTQLNIRATEYTVGDTGPEAMPGALPPSSGYTYALEYSVDEALAAGAVDVQFNQPLYHYVENFLNFPVGMLVPTGYYNRLKAAWFPSQNGRVVKIIAINSSIADLDTDGDGAADNNPALGITSAERQRLAVLYPAGQTLWRVPIEHFTPWDCNWPYGPPSGAGAPPSNQPTDKPPSDKPDCKTGSIIECQNQTLREEIPLVGTPFSLNYSSDRVPDRSSAYNIDILLSEPTLPAGLKRIDLNIEIAGRRFTQAVTPAPNQTTSFTWDGLDAYGRTVISRQPATVRLGYVYDAVYQEPNTFGNAFAAYSGIPISANSARQEITLWKIWKPQLGGWDSRTQGLGGWTLNIQHAYDPVARVLYLGDGSRRSANTIGSGVINTFAGGGMVPGAGTGDGGPATGAELSAPTGLDFGPDGSIYIVESGAATVRRVDPLGIITTVAGLNGQTCFPTTAVCGDGGPATAARLTNPADVAIGPDGSLYIADRSNHRVRRVGPDGIISTVAGTGVIGFSGDGGPAAAARLSSPYGVEVGPDGSLYIADRDNSRIRMVGPDGVISTVAGGVYGFAGDGGPAVLARLAQPWQVKLGPDGSLYILDYSNNRVRRVGPEGIISTVAGNGLSGYSGDGGPAASARLSAPQGLAVGPDGSLYIGDRQNYRVRWVGSDGIISTIAGSGAYGFGGDGGPAVRALLLDPAGVALAPDGSLYIADIFNQRVRRVTSALPGFTTSDLLIPAEDGQELYVFTGSGRHLRTLHTLTGAVLYEFAYDLSFRLTTVTDGSGNVTSIQRTGAIPNSITSPDGHITTFTLNPSGFLTGLTNPAGEAYQFATTPGGLLSSLTNPRGFSTTFTYDSLGRLILHHNAANGDQTLFRSQSSDGYTVTHTTDQGLVTVYNSLILPNGANYNRNTLPDGSQNWNIFGVDGIQIQREADGITTTQQYGPDPRWGMLASVTTSKIVSTPGGLSDQTLITRTTVLTDTANPLSLTAQTEATRRNGALFLSTYTAADRQRVEQSPEGRLNFRFINAIGQLTQEQSGGLAASHYVYDARGRLISLTAGAGPDARTILVTYNPAGQIATLTNAAHQTTSYIYNSAGRLISETGPDGQTTGFTYDANGNLVSLTPPGRPDHLFSYSPLDLITQYTPPDVNPGTDATLYTYDLDQHLTQITRPDGQTISVGYDSAGRPSTVTIARGVFTYLYAALSGNLASLSAPGGVNLNYTYDGSLLASETWSGPVTGQVGRSYNADFRIREITVSNANPLAYSYDLDGLLVGAGALALNYSPLNRLRLGSTLGIITDTVRYNGFGEAVQYRSTAGGANLLSVNYARDTLGRIAVLTETVGVQTNRYAYSYNLVGQLTNVTQNGNPAATYTYNANGSRLTGMNLAGVHTGTYDLQDRLTQYGSIVFTYNAAGDRQTRTDGTLVTTYTYDALGSLLAVSLPGGSQISYLVDGQNRRVGKLVNGVRVQGFVYEDDLRIAAELDAANQVVSRFVYAGWDNVPAYMLKGGTTYRLITDHLGSLRLVVNASTGAITQRMDYDEFGNVLLDTNPGFQPFGFGGGLYDRDTHLVRFRMRDYDPEVGSWTARDPILFVGQATNLYSYVGNDPINQRDSHGLCGCNGPDGPKDWPKLFDYGKTIAKDSFAMTMGVYNLLLGKGASAVAGTGAAVWGMDQYLKDVDSILKEIKQDQAKKCPPPK